MFLSVCGTLEDDITVDVSLRGLRGDDALLVLFHWYMYNSCGIGS